MIRNYLKFIRTSNINVYKFLNFEKIMLTISLKRISELLDIKKDDEEISIIRKKRNFCTFLDEDIDLTKIEKSKEKDETEATALTSKMFNNATLAVELRSAN